MFRTFLVVLALVGLLSFSLSAQEVRTENLTDECITEFDAEVDYFPDKVEITDARNFNVSYFNNYKVVTVNGSVETYDYVLVQCGTPAPDIDAFPEGTQFVEIPTGHLVSLSTTFLPGIVQIGLGDYIVGVDNILFTSTPEIVMRIDKGGIIEVAPNAELNVEILLNLEPEIVLTDDFDLGRLAQIIDSGITAAISTDYLEGSPLARAEWLKYTALFYNAEAIAEETYGEIVKAYDEARKLTADVSEAERPTVLWNTFSTFSDAWSIPGMETYPGRLIQDAGGYIALAEETSGDAALLSFETVYDKALDADIWIINAFAVFSTDDLIAQDERYAGFTAISSGNVWNNDLDVNEYGGNNYFERGVTAPHLVLQDLIAMFHPDLLPDHEFTFFRQLETVRTK